MPSLKMKINQAKDSMQEKNCIHVSSKSTKISKSSLSSLKFVRNAEDVASIVQTATQAVSCNKEHSLEIAHEKFNNDETLSGDLLTDQKHHAPFTNLTAFNCRMECMPASCPTSSDTIFSSILESIDINSDSYFKYFASDNNLSIPRLEAEDSDDSSKGLGEYYDCSVSDFFISDMISSAIPALSDSVYDDHTDFRFTPDYKYEEPIASFEMDTERLPVPYLRGDAENGRVCENATESSDSSLYLAINQLSSCSPESELSNYAEADQAECFDPHVFIRNIPYFPDLASHMPSSILSTDNYKTRSITLVLDLDETLVHSTLDRCDDADFTFPVFFNTKEHTVYVKQRPHLHTFLKRAAEMFDVVIFTASLSIYAKKLLDILDPEGKIFSRRAYRDSCLFSNGCYTKDLTVFGVDLAKVVIIDNTPQVFRLQVNNGIPIKTWFDDPSDSALLSLLPFLESLVNVDDVRPIIAKRFGNKD